ncbi:MAG: imidazole glycerol phosphate synthase subunit HisF [candidate division Zixibacteria bacterium]|nr:imidazole glycerol phosphate synthase subunit HisF [candidate division Zixibacteria bacterium]
MLKTRIMPCLLVDEGRLVKTVRFKKPNYIGDPINAIKIYNEKEVDELILLDITATKESHQPPFELIEEVASECFMPLAYGGGIKSLDDMKKIYNIGVEKIIINSYVSENPNFIREAADVFGSQSVVVSIDVKKNLFGKYTVRTHGGTKDTKADPVVYASRVQELGAGEIVVNAIDCDGMMNGYDIELMKRITSAVTVPVIALGGAGSVEDIEAVVTDAGVSAAAAGSLFVYQGKDLGVLINFPRREELEERLI